SLRGVVSTGSSRAAAAANAAAHPPAVAVAPAQPQQVEPVAAVDAAGPRPALAAPARPSIVANLTATSPTTQPLTSQTGHPDAGHGAPACPGPETSVPAGPASASTMPPTNGCATGNSSASAGSSASVSSPHPTRKRPALEHSEQDDGNNNDDEPDGGEHEVNLPSQGW